MSPGWPSDFPNRAKVVMLEDEESRSFGTEKLLGIENNDNVVMGSNFGNSLPLIPVQPISQEAARDIMENLENEVGWNLPDGWDEGNLIQSGYKVIKLSNRLKSFQTLLVFYFD